MPGPVRRRPAALTSREVAGINELLSAAGGDASRVKSLMLQALEHWVKQCYVVTSDVWERRRGDDSVAFAHLRDVYGQAADWDAKTILGLPALEFFRRINEDVHCTARTPGAQGLKPLVIQVQGGDFCAMCGARDGTVVDHIVPVHRAGEPDALSNLQLLCTPCNSAKLDLPEDLLPACLATTTTNVPSPRTRFKALLDSSIELDGRSFGACSCGATSRDGRLWVRPAPPAAAANIVRLRVTCGNHESRGD